MDPIRLKLSAAALGATVLVATAVLVGGRAEDPAPAALALGDDALVERVTTALQTPAATPPETAEAEAVAADPDAATTEDTAAAIASATRLALGAIVADDVGPSGLTAPQAEATGFRRMDETAAPDFVINAADAWVAAQEGWVTASGVAPATIALRPRPRAD